MKNFMRNNYEQISNKNTRKLNLFGKNIDCEIITYTINFIRLKDILCNGIIIHSEIYIDRYNIIYLNDDLSYKDTTLIESTFQLKFYDRKIEYLLKLKLKQSLEENLEHNEVITKKVKI